MPRKVTEDISKLPAWAQRRLVWAEREMERLTQELATLSGEVAKDASFYIEQGGIRNVKRPLLPHDVVAFEFIVDDHPRPLKMWIRRKSETIEVSGDGRMAVIPDATNVIRIKPIGWRSHYGSED